MKDKPPIGVKPLSIHRDQRIIELSRAIMQYTEFNSDSDGIWFWGEELIKLLKEKYHNV